MNINERYDEKKKNANIKFATIPAFFPTHLADAQKNAGTVQIFFR